MNGKQTTEDKDTQYLIGDPVATINNSKENIYGRIIKKSKKYVYIRNHQNVFK